MKIGPKYKIAKRLGAPIFEKTQTQKFALSEARSSKQQSRRHGTISDYKRQLIEKQKMRYTYGVSEKQLRRYVSEAVTKSTAPIEHLIARLESRLDNVVYRLGLAKTRQAARQIVAHGHITVDGRRCLSPSCRVKVGAEVAVREGSQTSVLFASPEDNTDLKETPSWLRYHPKHRVGTKKAEPVYEPAETLFDPQQVLEYYSR